MRFRRLNLAAYAPLRYVLPHKRDAYDEKYSTRLVRGEGFFRQADREESLVQLLRVNALKRMESSVVSFALTVRRQLSDVDQTLARIEEQAAELEEIDIADVDIEGPRLRESAGRPQGQGAAAGRGPDPLEAGPHRGPQSVDHPFTRRLARSLPCGTPSSPSFAQSSSEKCQEPINPGNRKVVVFTAFADTTARYLYGELAPWARDRLGLESALITRGGPKPGHAAESAKGPCVHPDRPSQPRTEGKAGGISPKKARIDSPHRH